MNHRRPPISAAVICYNEEQSIARCLDAIRWCEQIVVVDSGSTDRTVSIAKTFPGTHILVRPFDSYINQKNFALENCCHEWVLSVDADEIITPALAEEIENLAFDTQGYLIGRRTFLGSREIKHGNWSPDYNLRLFCRSQGRWGGSNPHERVVLEGRTRHLKARMLHYSFRDREEFLQRNRKYTAMSVEHLARQGRTTYWGEPLLHGLTNFFKAYLLRGGFLDGDEGLFLAYHYARFSYLKYCKLAARQKGDAFRPRGLRHVA